MTATIFLETNEHSRLEIVGGAYKLTGFNCLKYREPEGERSLYHEGFVVGLEFSANDEKIRIPLAKIQWSEEFENWFYETNSELNK